MKVLWILYNTVGSSGKYVGGGRTQGGGWVDATMQELLLDSEIQLTIAAIADEDKKVVSETGVVYYAVGGIEREIGGELKDETTIWEKLIKEVEPDIIQVWGTEFRNGLSMVAASKKYKKPILFYIQGVAQAIAAYPQGGIATAEYHKYIGMFSRWKLVRDVAFQKKLEKQSQYEKEMVSLSNGIIGDNEWCSAYFNGTDVYRHSLPVNNAFIYAKHKDEEAEPYSMICCAGRGAHKGLHVLIKALPIIKKEYPNAKVYIPGNMNSRTPKWLFEPAYITYINKLIDALGVRENVVFCGQLSLQEMAERMNKSQVFVLPSCIENHSSTLREAMYLGLPCVTTMVGSVHEFVQHKENGLIFRYAESEQLAMQVKYLFANTQERIRIGKNAYESIRRQFPQEQIGVIGNIYKQVIKKMKKDV